MLCSGAFEYTFSLPVRVPDPQTPHRHILISGQVLCQPPLNVRKTRRRGRQHCGTHKPTGSIKIRVETIGYFLKRYREDKVRNKQKTNNIDRQLKEFEVRLRRQMPRDRMDDSRIQESFEHGSMPQIHVSIGALAASHPPSAARVSGD